jgi:hypothetical protein
MEKFLLPLPPKAASGQRHLACFGTAKNPLLRKNALTCPEGLQRC